MDQSANIQSIIINFFKYFYQAYDDIKKILKDAQRDAFNIYNLSERHKKLDRSNMENTPLNINLDMKDKLLYCILNEINKSLHTLKQYQNSINKIVQNIKDKQTHLARVTYDVDYESDISLVAGSALQPRLSTLLEYSDDCVSFFSQISMQMKNIILFIPTENSYNKLLINDAFKIDRDTQSRLDEIFMYTKFCDKNELD